MIIGKNNLIEFIRTNNTPYWYLRRSEKSEPVFTCDDDTDKTLEESINRLNMVLNLLGPGNYFIESWYKKGQTKMRAKDSFAFSDSSINGIANNQPVIAGEPVDVNAKIAEALNKFKTERELEDIKKELAQIKKEKLALENSTEASIGRVIGRLNDTTIGGIIAAFLPNYKPAAAVSGVDGTKQTPEELTARLEAAFEKWGKLETDPITLIEKIAEMAATDQDTYKVAKNILLKK